MMIRTTNRKPVNPKLPAPYNTMTAAELEHETAQYDHEISDSRIRPLTASQRAEERKARRRPGRPAIGKGSEKINITIERGLLRDADNFAKRQNTSRSQIIAMALAALLGRKAG
jgi:hypothetical protein